MPSGGSRRTGFTSTSSASDDRPDDPTIPVGAPTVGRSSCLTCHRLILPRTLRAPNVCLDEPDFCGPCGRPRDERAAVWQTAAWAAMLVSLFKGRAPSLGHKGVRIRGRRSPITHLLTDSLRRRIRSDDASPSGVTEETEV